MYLRFAIDWNTSCKLELACPPFSVFVCGAWAPHFSSFLIKNQLFNAFTVF